MNAGVGAAAAGCAILLSLGQRASIGSLCLVACLGSLIGAAGYAADPGRLGALHTAVLMGIVLALARPFLQPAFVGAGDAGDYYRMFADFAQQHRSGMHEVFVGQTAFAYEGTVHTTRTSPMLYHVGALLDALSLRSLDYLILEKITLFAFFAGTALAFYLCCGRGLGMGPLPSLLNAGAFLAAPGILAPIYFSDMYATFSALPFLAIFLTAVILLGEGPNKPGNWVLLGIGSGGLFWTHPPIAAWAHLAAFFSLVSRFQEWRGFRPGTLLCAAPLLLVVAYPIVATLELGAVSVSHPREIAASLRAYHFEHPGAWTHLLWVSPDAAGSNSFKDWSSSWVLGVPAVAALLLAFAMVRRVRSLRPLLMTSAVLIFLMNGFCPRAAGWLWKLVPDVLVRITLYWPLQRFNPIVACSAFLGVACVMASLEKRVFGRRRTTTLIQGSFLALSLVLALRLQAVPASETISPGLTREVVKSDNIIVPSSNYDFMNAGLAFRYITTGRSDALSEVRLHDKSDYSRVLDIFSMRGAERPEFSSELAYKRFGIPICDKVKVPAQTITVLSFENLPPGLAGTLEIRANGASWAYLLPCAPTGDLAFGTGEFCRRSLLIRNSDPVEKVLEFYFWPLPAAQGKKIPLGTLVGYPVVPGNHYLSLNGLLPFDLNLDAPYRVEVETPRIFLNGYVAEIDGRRVPVSKSPQGLASVSVDKGPHRLTMRFEPDRLLKWSYRLAIASWIFLIGYGACIFYGRGARPRDAAASAGVRA